MASEVAFQSVLFCRAWASSMSLTFFCLLTLLEALTRS